MVLGVGPGKQLWASDCGWGKRIHILKIDLKFTPKTRFAFPRAPARLPRTAGGMQRRRVRCPLACAPWAWASACARWVSFPEGGCVGAGVALPKSGRSHQEA